MRDPSSRYNYQTSRLRTPANIWAHCLPHARVECTKAVISTCSLDRVKVRLETLEAAREPDPLQPRATVRVVTRDNESCTEGACAERLGDDIFTKSRLDG